MSNPNDGTTPDEGAATATPTEAEATESTPTPEEDSSSTAAETATEPETSTDEGTTPEPTPEVTVSTPNPVIEHLATLGVEGDAAQKIVALGVSSPDDLAFLTESDLASAGLPVIQARKLLAAVKPNEVSTASSASVDPNSELGDDEEPTQAHISGFAGTLGMDPVTLMMFMNGGAMGGEFDLSGMMPIEPVVQGYNPKRRDMFMMVMGQIEARLGVPIVVIDADGSINRQLTVEYVQGLEEGFEPAENNIYDGSDGTPHEVIRVGVDTQSIYDADPLRSSKALPKNGIGIGRINWTGVPLEVRQVCYYAVNETKEIDPNSDTHQAWLRDHITKTSNRLVFRGIAPRAIGVFNEARRTGSLPTLRVSISRNPRKQEIMPRRRRAEPRDLSAIGGSYNSGRD